MPRRQRKVRVSVRTRTIVKDDTWGTHTDSWAHTRWQNLRSLTPLRGDQIFEIARSGFNASWRATCRATPEISDGMRLVTFVDGRVELIFGVVKSLRRGKERELFLEEIGAVQS